MRRGAAAGVPLALLLALVPSQPGAEPYTEWRLYDLLNRARVEHGLPPLALRWDLVRASRAHSERMARAGRIFHDPSPGRRVCCWVRIGENVAAGHGNEQVHRALMRSASHRRVMLDPGWHSVGVGFVIRDGLVWATQTFAEHGSQASPASPQRRVEPRARRDPPRTLAHLVRLRRLA